MCECLFWNAALGAIVLGNAFYQALYGLSWPLLVHPSAFLPCLGQSPPSALSVHPSCRTERGATTYTTPQRSPPSLGALASPFRLSAGKSSKAWWATLRS